MLPAKKGEQDLVLLLGEARGHLWAGSGQRGGRDAWREKMEDSTLVIQNVGS